jgi:hypothetical protein
MPSFGNKSLEELESCDPALQRLAHRAIKVYDFTVLEGHRGEAAQNRSAARGLSQVKWPDGKHNAIPSKAFDVAPWIPDLEDGPIPWDLPGPLGGLVDAAIANIEFDSPGALADYQRRLWNLEQWRYLGGLIVGVGAGMGLVIRWGGDWDRDGRFSDQTFHDLPHFELVAVGSTVEIPRLA